MTTIIKETIKEKRLTPITMSIKKSDAKFIDHIRKYFISFITLGAIKYEILYDDIFNKQYK